MQIPQLKFKFKILSNFSGSLSIFTRMSTCSELSQRAHRKTRCSCARRDEPQSCCSDREYSRPPQTPRPFRDPTNEASRSTQLDTDIGGGQRSCATTGQTAKRVDAVGLRLRAAWACRSWYPLGDTRVAPLHLAFGAAQPAASNVRVDYSFNRQSSVAQFNNLAIMLEKLHTRLSLSSLAGVQCRRPRTGRLPSASVVQCNSSRWPGIRSARCTRRKGLLMLRESRWSARIVSVD